MSVDRFGVSAAEKIINQMGLVFAGNIIIMQMDYFGNPHSGRVHGCKHGLVFNVINGIQQTVDLIRCKYSREFPLYNHARNYSIIPKDVQDIPVKKVECRIVKIQSCRFESAVFFGKQEIPDVLAGKFFRAFAGIIQEIGNVVFITVNGTIFEVADFSGFFKLFYIFFIHNESSI